MYVLRHLYQHNYYDILPNIAKASIIASSRPNEEMVQILLGSDGLQHLIKEGITNASELQQYNFRFLQFIAHSRASERIIQYNIGLKALNFIFPSQPGGEDWYYFIQDLGKLGLTQEEQGVFFHDQGILVLVYLGLIEEKILNTYKSELIKAPQDQWLSIILTKRYGNYDAYKLIEKACMYPSNKDCLEYILNNSLKIPNNVMLEAINYMLRVYQRDSYKYHSNFEQDMAPILREHMKRISPENSAENATGHSLS